jgi:hypothetical protein
MSISSQWFGAFLVSIFLLSSQNFAKKSEGFSFQSGLNNYGIE